MARPEPMNATPHHAKVKVSLYFSDNVFVSGEHITGKMELECRAERGLDIGVIKTELFAIQELTSRDHSATSTFLHMTRCFQGPGLPPSNAVHPQPSAESDPLPTDHYPARKGTTTFFFRFPLPVSSPASIDFGKGLAKLKYEVRASVGVAWKSERQFVMERKEVEVVEAPGGPSDLVGTEHIVVGENGKVWVQGRILNPYIVAGHSACLELFVRNHSAKRTSGLNLSLMRYLHLPAAAQSNKTLQISDALLSLPFRGPDYIVHPGTEGVANLAFSVPRHAQGVRSGRLDSGEEDDEPREMESLFDVRCIIEVTIGMGLGNKDIILELPVTVIHPAAMKGLPPSPERLVTSPAPHPRIVSPPPMSFPAYTSQRPVEAFDANYMNPPIPPPVYFAHSQSPPPLLHPIQPAYNQYYYYPPPPIAPYARPSSADPFAAQQLPVLPNQNQAIAVSYVNTDVVAGEYPQDSLVEGEPGKGERASRISAHLRMSSRNRSVSPQSHRFPQATSSVVATEDSPVTPQIRSAHTLHLTPVSGAGGIGTSPDSKAGLLSPRPVLSHKQSFDHGTVKSERVVDLERMAAAEVASKEKNDSRDKSLPRQPPHSEIQTPDTPRLPPEPTLAPIATRLRPDIWNRESGLEALERKLLEQVGTRKHEPERRPDVRSVLPHPITIPPSNMHRSDPFNDSAISSLALGADGPFANSRSPPPTALKENFFSPPSPLSEILDDRKSAEKDSRGKVQGREKQSEVHQLRKAATGRVAAWLGGIDPAIPPPPSDTPATSSPKTPAEDILPALDLDPHPLLRSPSILPAIESAPDMSPAIPTRSSGFILHTAKDTPSSFEPPKSDEEECPRAKTPTQSHPPAEPPGLTTPTKADPPPTKPVLRRFADLPTLPQPPGVKYDIRSARGGRGGKVTSVATLWASLTSQQEADPPSFPPHAKAGAFSPTFKKLKIPDLPGKPVVPSRSPPYNRKQHEAANPHLAELTNRRAKMTKSSSVPAVISSSLATPVLSSTASLARPLRTSYPKYPYPQSNATASIPEAPLHPARPKSVTSGDHAFGQARLKDLIKKYQQGFGQ